jgi:7-carboxy-7-deazaguanine synthase
VIPLVPDTAKHRIKLLENLGEGELLIHEIYLSVQGESAYAGLPCVFVRTAVCDLRCSWCDTPHAFNKGERMARQAVLEKALSYDCPLVELTGGEPLLQPEVLPLMKDLADAGRRVLIETSGAQPVSRIDSRVHVVMDLKCPDSGECERNHWDNLNHLKPTDEIKFVIATKLDWEWTVQTIRQHQLDSRFSVLVSCAFREVDPVQLVGWLLEAKLFRVRMQLQMHKYIWDPAKQGV